jgi:hypothetical protein
MAISNFSLNSVLNMIFSLLIEGDRKSWWVSIIGRLDTEKAFHTHQNSIINIIQEAIKVK